MNYFVIMHIFCCIITFYREVYEASMDAWGQAMRFMEVVGIFIYYGSVLSALNYVTRWMTLSGDESQKKLNISEPGCLQNQKVYKSMAGNSIEWFEVELMIFIFFMFTMIFLLTKSRVSKVGVDQSGQFEAIYIQKMIDKLVLSFDFDL